jgi:PKHD-type hydroxylase
MNTFVPPQNLGALIASGPHAFADSELDAIEQLGEKLSLITATLGGYGEVNRTKRVTRIAAIEYNTEHAWVYDRLNRVVAILGKRFGFELAPFRESLQFMVYRQEDGGHFSWHSDQGPTVNRKLSLTLQLSNPASYQGCDLEFMHDGQTMTAPRERGMLVAFPSHIVHRVTPVTRGIRKSIVAWVPAV